MPENNTSPLVNMTALNAAYDLIKQQLDERVYKTSTNPNEVLGSVDAPYPSAYIGSNVLDASGTTVKGKLTAREDAELRGKVTLGKHGDIEEYTMVVTESAVDINRGVNIDNTLTVTENVDILGSRMLITDSGVSTSLPFIINGGQSSTSTSTGALRVTGGVSISENLYVGGTFNVGSGLFLVSSTRADINVPFNTGALTAGRFTASSDCDFSNGALKTSANSVVVPAGSVFTVEGNANLGGNVVLANSTALINQSYALFTTPVQINNATASTSLTTGALTVTGGIGASGDIWGAHVHNAVGNDIADAITTGVDLEPGYCYAYDGNHWFKTEGKDSPYMGIHSDTAGYILGYDKSKKQILISVGGFVLAYTDKIYDPGTFLTYTNDGLLTKAKEGDERIAKFFRTEPEPYYHNIKVNGRNWVKVMH